MMVSSTTIWPCLCFKYSLLLPSPSVDGIFQLGTALEVYELKPSLDLSLFPTYYVYFGECLISHFIYGISFFLLLRFYFIFGLASLPPVELKKLRAQQRKAAKKAEQEKQEKLLQQQREQREREQREREQRDPHSHHQKRPHNQPDKESDAPPVDDLQPQKLARVGVRFSTTLLSCLWLRGGGGYKEAIQYTNFAFLLFFLPCTMVGRRPSGTGHKVPPAFARMGF